MEAVKKAASGAVETIRNSPLFRRKFGTYQKASSNDQDEQERPISPEKDRTPFVQGIYFQADYLGKQPVISASAQDHGCTDEAIQLLWDDGTGSEPKGLGVSLRLTTTNLRVKRISDGDILFDFPLFRVTYCGTDKIHKEAFSFVAKELDEQFYCYVFRCSSKEKAYAIALTLAKAFYLAYQILQEQQGDFPPTPDRETVFEPQRPDDTHASPHRPVIPEAQPPQLERHPSAEQQGQDLLEFTDEGPTPALRVTRPSQASMVSDTGSMSAHVDDDFTRLAKARSNPDILRSTLDTDDITGNTLHLVHLHADPGSVAGTPGGSPLSSPHTTPRGSTEDLDAD